MVGLSGLRWSDVSPSATPALWRLAPGLGRRSRVDYAVKPLTCPADGSADASNAGARAQSEHANAGCGAFPPVTVDGPGAEVPGLAAIERYNQQFHNDPHWGLLAGSAPIGAPASGDSCTTAVGPGGALALAGGGHVSSYLPSPAQVTGAVLARCPLTVVDLGVLGACRTAGRPRRGRRRARPDPAGAPACATVLVTAPGAASKPPHLQVALVSGPGYQAGVLDAASTRQPARPGRPHRPERDRARLARPDQSARRGRPWRSPAATGVAELHDRVDDQPGHRGTGVEVHSQRVLLDLARWPTR